MLRRTQILLWRTGALTALVLGVLGIAIPVLPTVPFLIVSAWAAGKGWPSLERWLLEHPAHGPHIRNWRERGAVPRKAKLFAILTMFISAVALQFTAMPPWLQLAAPLAMLTVAGWLWMRPEV